MKTLILGMGNPILSDDGVGLHVARALEGHFAGTDVHASALIGLDILDIVAGYDQVFVIDAIQDGSRLPGTVLKLAAGEGALHLFSSHGACISSISCNWDKTWESQFRRWPGSTGW